MTIPFWLYRTGVIVAVLATIGLVAYISGDLPGGHSEDDGE